NKQSESEFSQEILADTYLENITRITSEVELSFGKIKNKNIGYIYLGSMNGENPAIINSITKELESSQAIILDIRQNTGGEDRYGARIAGAFADAVNLIYTVQTRNGPDYSDFDGKKEYFTIPDGNEPYLKPVIVLTDRRTISAGEVFLLHMKSFEHIVQVGDTTAGDFSTVSNRRFLPNGWTYQYSIQKFLLPDGSSLDGIGHVPDVYAKNAASDITAGNDKVMERALTYLSEEFGIE
ncbi:MAG: S41 family peptidase, partial [Pricia sp.]